MKIYFRLPQDVFQTAKVAKVLLLLEKGKEAEFKGKLLEDIELDNEIYCSSDEEEELPLSERVLNRLSCEAELTCTDTNIEDFTDTSSRELKQFKENRTQENADLARHATESKGSLKLVSDTVNSYSIVLVSVKLHADHKIRGRVRWSAEEKKTVLTYFREHIRRKITPKKHECDELIKSNKHGFLNKDWVRIKTFV